MKIQAQQLHGFDECLQKLQDGIDIHIVTYGPRYTTCILKRELLDENEQENQEDEENDSVCGQQLKVLTLYVVPTEKQNVWIYTIYEYDEQFVKSLRDKKSGISDDEEYAEMLKRATADKYNNQRQTDFDQQYGCMEADNHQRWYRYNIARMAQSIQGQIERDEEGDVWYGSSPKPDTSLLAMKNLVAHIVNSSLLLAHHAIKSFKTVLLEEMAFNPVSSEHQTIFDDFVLNHLWQTYLPWNSYYFNKIFEKISYWHKFDEDLSDVDLGQEKRTLQLRKGMAMLGGGRFGKGIYYGETLKGEKHGKGILICNTQSRLYMFEAWFNKGVPIKGRAFDYMYPGSWSAQTGRFKPNYDQYGQGTRIREDNVSYEGELDKYALITGYGQILEGTCFKEGYFIENTLKWGRLKTPDGEIYEGTFTNGNHLSNGKKTFSNGNVLMVTNLQGDYKSGFLYSNAKMIQPNGDYQIGDWKNDVAIGVHRYYTKDDVFIKVSIILYIHILGDNISLRDKMIKGIFSFVNYTQA
ncbi:hypothetical protein FGO68_gene58 [Halteria grandinella]|uniref:MORN repeat protein n=1 Tax=Halteria grandinella TaxID=5974 RepID=A0A8J8T286_HALGN|nr:hypothetical protein FGO68_gene58 [Halteria grandinella]